MIWLGLNHLAIYFQFSPPVLYTPFQFSLFFWIEYLYEAIHLCGWLTIHNYCINYIYKSISVLIYCHLRVYIVFSKLLICVQFFAPLRAVACQTPPFVEFSRQEYWSELPCFLQGIFWPRDWTCISYVSCIGRWVLYHYKPRWFIVSTFNFLPSSNVYYLTHNMRTL